jgi:Tol biopolymer transport system component
VGGTTKKIVLAIVLAGLLPPAGAQATFPGANGMIAFATNRDYPLANGGGFEIYTMDPDGTNPARLTSNTTDDLLPAWSPDGSKIAFERDGYIYTMNADGTNPTQRTNSGSSESPAWSPDGTKIAFDTNRDGTDEIYTINADGSNPTRLTNNTVPDFSPAWSPDGTKIAFVRLTANSYEIYTMNADGTGETALTNNTALDRAPDWSPDGTKIAFESNRDSTSEIYTMNADGSNPTRLTNDVAHDWNPVWSPDGTEIAFQTNRDGNDEIYTMNADGSNPTRLTNNTAYDLQPDWQSIPINSYPRPKGATPLRLALVPAYQECTSPNRMHGAALALGSCAPPQLGSSQLTIGTPDSNGKFGTMVASIELRTIVGDPSTPENEADVQISVRMNDVFTKDLSDYTGALRASLPVQITDRDNGPSPGGAGAATTVPFEFGFDVPCTPTPTDATVGSDCTIATTADTLYPGAITEGQRAIWQMGRGRIDDAGPDGNPDTTADNTVFATQGVFVP